MDNVRTENIDLNVASHAYYFNIADFIVKILLRISVRIILICYHL